MAFQIPENVHGVTFVQDDTPGNHSLFDWWFKPTTGQSFIRFNCGWTEIAKTDPFGFGYAAGGNAVWDSGDTPVNTIERIVYAASASTVVCQADMSAVDNKYAGDGCGSSSRGYGFGTYYGTPSLSIFGLAFASDSSVYHAADSQKPTCQYCYCCNSSLLGYSFGGSHAVDASTYYSLSTIENIAFATEAVSVQGHITGSTTTDLYGCIASGHSFNTTTKGFSLGGVNMSNNSWIFTTEVFSFLFSVSTDASKISSALTKERRSGGSVNSTVSGYLIKGGENSGAAYYTDTEKFNFATETSQALSNDYGYGIDDAASNNSSLQGFTMGGRIYNNSDPCNVIQSLMFSVDFVPTIAESALSVNRWMPYGFDTTDCNGFIFALI